MAGKVNTKFVVVAAVIAVALAGGAIIIGAKALSKSASDHIRMGDEAAAAGKWKDAIEHYSQGVNEDQKNVEYLKKWIGALEKFTPDSKQAYQEWYMQQYFGGALTGLALADTSSYDTQKRYLDEVYERARRLGADLATWESVARTADETLNRFTGDDQSRKKLTRYRGLGRTQVLAYKPQRTPDEVKAARQDLAAALEVLPGDQDVFLADVGLEMSEIQKLRDLQQSGDADTRLIALKRRMEDFAKSQAPAANVMLSRYQMELNDLGRVAPKGSTMRDIVLQLVPPLTATVEAFEKTPPEQIEGRRLISLAISGVAVVDTLNERTKALLEKVVEAQPNDTKFLNEYADYLLNTNQTEAAVAVWQKVVDMPTPPLSLRGMELMNDRPLAVNGQAEAMFLAWQQEKDNTKRADFAARAKKFRDQFVTLTGTDTPRVAAIDARLKYIDGDVNAARALISRYNDQTGRIDAQSVLFEGELMRRLENRGAAITAYKRVLELQPNNMRAMISLGELYAVEGDNPQALAYFQNASQRMPGDEGLKRRVKDLEDSMKDPVLRQINAALDRVRGVNRDVPGAESILEKLARETGDDPRVMGAWAQVVAGDNRKDFAKQLVDRGLAKSPDHEGLKQLKSALSINDPVEANLATIDNQSTTPVQKLTQKYIVCVQAGQTERARQFLEQAKALGPTDPMVVEMAFIDAASRLDMDELNRLVKIAEDNNLDQLNGLLFRARRDIADAQRQRNMAAEKAGDASAAEALRIQARKLLGDAMLSLKQVTTTDKANPIGWRLLGIVQLELGDQGDPAGALEAFNKALAIRPNDLQSITGKLRCLVMLGRLDEALTFARDSTRLAGRDEDFRKAWLGLESTAPNGDKSSAVRVRREILKSEPDNFTNRVALIYLLMDERRFDDAKAEIDAVKASGRGLEATEMYANWYYRQGNFSQAVQVYKDYIEALPEKDRTLAVYQQAARSMRNLGQPAASLDFLSSARHLQDPKLMEVDRETADTLYSLNQMNEALTIYQAILEAGYPDPGNLVRARVAEGLLNVGKAQEAAAMLDKIGEDATRGTTMLLLQARVAIGQNDRAKARRMLDQACAGATANDPVPFVARAEFNLVDPQMARDVEQDLKEAIRRQPAFATARVRLANLYAMQNNLAAGLAQLAEGVRVDPSNDDLRTLYCQMLLQLNRPDEAAQAVEDILKARPMDVNWMLKGSQLMTQIGRKQRAVDLARMAYEKAKDIVPADIYIKTLLNLDTPDTQTALKIVNAPEFSINKNITALLLRSRIYLKANKPELALADMKAACALLDRTKPEAIRSFFGVVDDLYPKSADKVALLGRLEEVGRFDGWMSFFAAIPRLEEPTTKPRAIDDLNRLAEGQDKALQFASRGTLGIQAYKEGKLDEAAGFYRRALEIGPNDPEMNNNLAYTLLVMGKAGEAVEPAERGVAGAPTNPMILDTLGAVYMEVGKLPEAERVLLRALNLARSPQDQFPVILHAGLLKLKQGDKSQAAQALDSLKKLRNQFPDVGKEHDGALRILEEGVTK